MVVLSRDIGFVLIPLAKPVPKALKKESIEELYDITVLSKNKEDRDSMVSQPFSMKSYT